MNKAKRGAYIPPTPEEFSRRCLRVSMEATHDRAWVMECRGDETKTLHEFRRAVGETDEAWSERITTTAVGCLSRILGPETEEVR